MRGNRLPIIFVICHEMKRFATRTAILYRFLTPEFILIFSDAILNPHMVSDTPKSLKDCSYTRDFALTVSPGEPAFAQWNYRILCSPIEEDIPLKYFKQVIPLPYHCLLPIFTLQTTFLSLIVLLKSMDSLDSNIKCIVHGRSFRHPFSFRDPRP